MKTHEMIRWVKNEYDLARDHYLLSGSEYWFGRMNGFRELLNQYRFLSVRHKNGCVFCDLSVLDCERCFPSSEIVTSLPTRLSVGN